MTRLLFVPTAKQAIDGSRILRQCCRIIFLRKYRIRAVSQYLRLGIQTYFFSYRRGRSGICRLNALATTRSSTLSISRMAISGCSALASRTASSPSSTMPHTWKSGCSFKHSNSRWPKTASSKTTNTRIAGLPPLNRPWGRTRGGPESGEV